MNELIVPDTYLQRAETILRGAEILFDDRQYAEGDSLRPAESVLSIQNAQGEDEISHERIRKAFQLLKDNGVVVRYGRVPAGA